MECITDFVKRGFSGITAEAEAATAKLDAVADELATLSEEQFALAVAGLAKAIADKKAGATVVAIAQKLVPALLALL